jgi:hypothetical protein
MNRRFLVVSLLFSGLPLSWLAAPAEATTVVPPSDLGQLAKTSQTVTFAEAVESWSEDGEAIPFTVTRFQRLEAVAGAATGDVFEVREPGGRLKDRAAVVGGAPRFAAGHDYLLFLDRAPGGQWRSKMMAYGLLEQVAGTDLLRPLAEAGTIDLRPAAPAKSTAASAAEPVGLYRKSALLPHLREVVKGAAWNGGKVAAAALTGPELKALQNSPAHCVFLTDGGDGLPMRWFGFETGKTVTMVSTTPGQTGISDGGVAAVQQGLAAWTNHSDSVIRYVYGGARASNISCAGGFNYDEGGVVFNDPCEDIADLAPPCNGTLAFGGAIYDPTTTQTYDGQPWHPILSTFAVVNNGAQCVGETSFKETLTHELGHTMGFGHHDPPNPADATMSAFLKADGRGAAIAIVDQQCASYDYHTFLDVPYNYWTWRWTEAIENAGVTTGCGGGNYCPTGAMTRDEMALFLLRAKSGGSYAPPACTTPMFSDVPCSSSYAPWINELVRRGVTAGCGGGKYCPGNSVTRAQMAVFLLATLQGPGWSPPACTTPAFADMPCSSSFAPWVNELVKRGVTAGCGGGNYCPGSVVNRDQMSVFLSTTFNLPVPPAPPAP